MRLGRWLRQLEQLHQVVKGHTMKASTIGASVAAAIVLLCTATFVAANASDKAVQKVSGPESPWGNVKPNPPVGTVAYAAAGVRFLPAALATVAVPSPKVLGAQAVRTLEPFLADRSQAGEPTVELVLYSNDVAGDEGRDGKVVLDHQDELAWAVTWDLATPPARHGLAPRVGQEEGSGAALDPEGQRCRTIGLVNALTGAWDEVFTTCEQAIVVR